MNHALACSFIIEGRTVGLARQAVRIMPEGNVHLATAGLTKANHSRTAETRDGHVPKTETAECGRLGIETHSAREHHNKTALLNAHMPKQNAISNLTPHRGKH